MRSSRKKRNRHDPSRTPTYNHLPSPSTSLQLQERPLQQGENANGPPPLEDNNPRIVKLEQTNCPTSEAPTSSQSRREQSTPTEDSTRPHQTRLPRGQPVHYADSDAEAAATGFEAMQISKLSKVPILSQRNPKLLKLRSTRAVTYTQLRVHDREYSEVAGMINPKKFTLNKIEKINNPYLKKAFDLKKQQKKEQFEKVEERLLFRGIKQAEVDAICTMNFNWRRSRGRKYGRGITFSPNSTYASVNSDQSVVRNRVLIAAKVLVGRSCVGDQSMVVPPDGYDTTQKEGGIVIVKYEDSEFYPVYKISYHVRDVDEGRDPKFKKKVDKMAKSNVSAAMFLGDEDGF